MEDTTVKASSVNERHQSGHAAATFTSTVSLQQETSADTQPSSASLTWQETRPTSRSTGNTSG